MDVVLVAIGVFTGSAVALSTFYFLNQGAKRRAVATRVGIAYDAPATTQDEVLRRGRGGKLGFMRPVSNEARRRLVRELDQAGWPIRVGEFFAIRAAAMVTGLLGSVLTFEIMGLWPSVLGALSAVALMLAGWMLPRMMLSRKRDARMEKIETQLPDALMSMAKSLRAGSGLIQGFAHAADETAAPLGLELQRTVREIQLGAQAEDVLRALSERVGSPDLDIAITAIIIQRTAGGNLAEILINVTNTIRERMKIKGEVRVLTSRQRLTANMVALLPVLVAIAFVAIQPEMGKFLLTTTVGQFAMAAGAALELVGLWMVRKLGVIEV